MKKYCINCGYGNEYSGAAPIKCEKCKMDFSMATEKLTQALKRPLEELDDMEHFEDSEFDSYMSFEPESVTQQEIESLFLSNANKTISLKNLMEDAEKNAPPTKTVSKKRGRPAKKK